MTTDREIDALHRLGDFGRAAGLERALAEMLPLLRRENGAILQAFALTATATGVVLEAERLVLANDDGCAASLLRLRGNGRSDCQTRSLCCVGTEFFQLRGRL
jgi:hypothetical protein